ncbi:MAG TPA: ATP-binding protein [Anaerolineales bacterium]|nr:ATP-binding protein [Anaerolineales bacterium]
MGALFSQIFSLLTAPPGNLIYHLVLVFSIASALQSAFNHWRSSEFPQARRTMLGLGFLLCAQFFMFAFSGLGWQGIINPTASLPPLDRAFTLFSLLWITWLWAFPEPSRPADAAGALISLLIAAALGLSLLTWPPQSSLTTYNSTIDDLLWQIASIGFIFIGALILLIRRPNGYGNGLAVLALAGLGHLGHLAFPETGNYSGIIRLAYMAAYPILLTLPQRFPAPLNMGAINVTAPLRAEERPSKARTSKGKAEAPVQERRRYSTDPKTFHALLALAAESSAPRVSQAITRAIAQTMLSDLCFLLYLTENKSQIIITSGYDLIREESLEGGSLNKSSIPMLANAIQRGRPVRMPASSTSADIKGLGDLLGLQNPGNLLGVPIVTPEKDSLGGIILLSPYSNRLWSAEDQAFLANIAVSLVPIIQRNRRISQLEQIGEQAKQALETAQSRIAQLEKQSGELKQQLEATRAESEKAAAQSADLSSLLAVQEESQRTIEQMKKELDSARGRGRRTDSQVEGDLKTTLQDVARLQNQLAEANIKIMELESGGGPGHNKPSEQAEVLASISQELRQPMSSIVGYTDLLLGESIGILGALQRKFVERIKASTERIGSLIDDMIQVTTLESGLAEQKPEPVDLNLIIDNAMSYTSSQVREKNISLHLDLPKKIAPLSVDRESVQQIMIHLLQNAGAATPIEGTIHLKVQTTNENGQDYIMIQVTDSGGGIPPEDLPRVFTRLYRADNVLIQGIGDTGVGLSIAKTLTEAQHGRIWVENQPGKGATFGVLLPIAKEASPAPSDKEKP